MDSELLTPLLRLCCAALQHMPDVLALPNTLDTLLTMTQVCTSAPDRARACVHVCTCACELVCVCVCADKPVW